MPLEPRDETQILRLEWEVFSGSPRLEGDFVCAGPEQEASWAFDLFIQTVEAKYLSAVECLRKDRSVLLTFYDFPSENWCHIRTTNPIESTFATIRLRHRKTRNNGSARASLVMLFKLAQSVSRGWRKLRGHQHIPEFIKGVHFIDGLNGRPSKNNRHQAPNSLRVIPKSSPEEFSLNTPFGSNSFGPAVRFKPSSHGNGGGAWAGMGHVTLPKRFGRIAASEIHEGLAMHARPLLMASDPSLSEQQLGNPLRIALFLEAMRWGLAEPLL